MSPLLSSLTVTSLSHRCQHADTVDVTQCSLQQNYLCKPLQVLLTIKTQIINMALHAVSLAYNGLMSQD